MKNQSWLQKKNRNSQLAFLPFKQKILYGLMAVFFCCLQTVVANDSISTIALEKHTITSKRQEVYSELTRIIAVIDRNEIKAAPANNLADLLQYIAGADIRQRGSHGVQADLVIRGGTFDQVLILINGINITDPQTGHHNLNIPIDLDAVDRIELLQGPGSRVLGPNAFSGAINIITGADEKSSAQAKVEGGSYGLFSASAHASIVNKKTKAFVGVSNTSADGYMENTDYNIYNSFAQLQHSNKLLGDINLQLAYQDKNFGAYGFYTLLYPMQFEATKTIMASLSTKKTLGKFILNPQLYWRQHHDRFELFRDFENAPSWYSKHNYHQTDVVGAKVKADYYQAFGKTSAGIDYRLEHIYSNQLGEKMYIQRPIPFGPDSVFFTVAKGRHNLNYFVEQAIYLKKIAASLGILGNTSNDYGTNFYFGGDIGYTFSRSLKSFVSINQSLRLPTFTDLYLKSAVNQGNPDLKAEKALTYELGTSYQQKFFTGKVAVYYRNGKDVIDWVKLPTETKYTSKNHSTVNAMGTDITLAYAPQKWVKRIKLSYSFLHLDTESGAYDSKYALDYLKNKIGLSLEHRLYKTLGFSWQLNYMYREGNYTNAASELINYAPVFMCDVRMQMPLKRFTFYAEASNLFNTPYINYGVQQAGRWIRAGIKVAI